MIRTASIPQTLLGNIGRPGGGIPHCGHASIQGSTDIPTLFNILPRVPADAARRAAPRPRRVRRGRRRKDRVLGKHAVHMVSPLKSCISDAATPTTTSASTTCLAHRRRLDVHHGEVDDRRRLQGLLRGRGEPRRGSGQRQDAAARHGEPDWAGRPRPADDRDGDVLEGRPEIETGELVNEEMAPRCSSRPPRRTWRRPGRSRRPSGCCSGATRPWSRRGDCRSELQFYFELGRRIRQKLAGSTDEMDRPRRPSSGTTRSTSTAIPTGTPCCARSTAPDPDGAALSAYTEAWAR